jgi:hypothetical protein
LVWPFDGILGPSGIQGVGGYNTAQISES